MHFYGVCVQNFKDSKGTFKISHKILNAYTAKYAFYGLVSFRVSYDIFKLWRHKTK